MKQQLSFIDFCAGIGGGRVGLEKLGMTCKGFSEIDKDAEQTYKLFYGEDEHNYGNLMKINSEQLPEFDFLISGFPCQTFSIVGTRCGLNDEDRGQIIYGLSTILKEKNIKYFILENVKGLVNHDRGNTFKIVLDLLDKSGYKVFHKVLNSLDFGIPQTRERIYLVGIRKDLVDDDFKFKFPEKWDGETKNFEEYLIEESEEFIFDTNNPNFKTFEKYLNNKYNNKKGYKLEDLLKEEYLVIDTRQSDLRLYRNKVPTLRRGRHGILYVKGGKLRRLSGYETLLLQGFSKEFADLAHGRIDNGKLLQQTGNAMTTNVIEAIAKQLLNSLNGENKMEDKEILIRRGSETAKNGFKNEKFVIDEFNNWRESSLAQDWLQAMKYDLEEIEEVKAEKITGSYKADVQVAVLIQIKLKSLTDIQNLQVKLVSNPKGFNQIDKRWLRSYNELWNIPDDVYELLQHFTGEKSPKIPHPKDPRRMFATEFSVEEQRKLLNYFNENKLLIVSDILKGRGKFAAEWMLVILKIKDKNGNIKLSWALEPINNVLNIFGGGEVSITSRGSFNIGKITIQRKGGDNGRATANMLQFKINPVELINEQ
ncbi:MAG: DNA (cytosine-5-)-methyltransferase [Arcobacter sp.]|nr:DNA (cytosine-5-)-methyltransferase [Arcobacter sp.]